MYYIPSYYDSLYHPSVDQYEMLRRQRAYEQARRAEKRRREEEILRRRRLLYEEELARQQQQEAYYRKLAYEQERARQERLQRQRAMRASTPDEDDYVIVRGPGGYLYRVLRSDLEGPDQAHIRNENETTNETKVMNNDDDLAPPMSDEEETPMTEETRPTPSMSKKKNSQKNPKRKKKITVIVEDASDSENEGDELKSVWRNRHPAPGESWMEPIGGGL